MRTIKKIKLKKKWYQFKKKYIFFHRLTIESDSNTNSLFNGRFSQGLVKETFAPNPNQICTPGPLEHLEKVSKFKIIPVFDNLCLMRPDN